MLNQMTREWEEAIIDLIVVDIRERGFVTDSTGILQLSAEYSGVLAVHLSHKEYS